MEVLSKPGSLVPSRHFPAGCEPAAYRLQSGPGNAHAALRSFDGSERDGWLPTLQHTFRSIRSALR